jgi:hypothetical protein
MSRIVICGGPQVGKTTLAASLAERTGISVRHTDDLVGQLEWSDASLAVSTWLDAPGAWLVEGAACARALRKWLLRNPTGKPCDIVVALKTPHAERSRGQAAMGKGCETVFAAIADELRARGVTIVTENDASGLLAKEAS